MKKSAAHYFKWLPNIITFSRLLLSIAAFTSSIQQHWILALWLLLAALTTDFFDGFAARKLNATSKFGEEFDAITDSIIVALGMLSLGIAGKISWWIVLFVFVISFIISSDRFFKQPVWRWRAVLAVASLFIAWIGIVWFYAYLAYGWSWNYIALTLFVLIICGVLKRKRIAVWLPGPS